MKLFMLSAIFVMGWSGMLTVDVPTPGYEFDDGRVVVQDAAYVSPMGAPDVPSRIVSIALPPGAIVETVDFRGERMALGVATVAAAQPALPLLQDGVAADLGAQFARARDRYYSSENTYPGSYGTVIAEGGLRKYRLLTVACHHFAYNAISGTLYNAPNIIVEIHYTMPDPSSARAVYWRGLMDDITADGIAEELIYNWTDAQVWYHTDSPRRANGYYVIIPSAIESSVDALVMHRASQGYDVHVITREYIEANVSGDDVPQKLRNYLRANMLDIDHALLVGFSTDMPWRDLVPFNNDPNSPWNNPDYSPIPGDLYLAELTDPDSLSWNSDGDAYYGEVFDANFQPPGDDNPDYHADIHLGRIPFSSQSVIEDICAKLIAFDTNTDIAYKTSSLLTGALYYYANENNSGNARMDGADYCEQLLIDSVLSRATATTLYEKGGLDPCTLSCSDSLNQSNHIVYWQNKGVMYECHHGNVPLYARKLWAWDDGDGIPENAEITWPTSLYITDVHQLDNAHPATCFLRSCLCGKPEETGLGAMLLYRGGSAVISSSRVSWASSSDIGGIPYHFYDHLLQDTLLSEGIIGLAYDMARTDFMNNSGFWMPAYHYNLFGDPALRQFGQLVNVEENMVKTPISGFTVFPNPSKGGITFSMQSPLSGEIRFEVYDVSGRLVTSMVGIEQKDGGGSISIDLPGGVYFVDCTQGNTVFRQKVTIVE